MNRNATKSLAEKGAEPLGATRFQGAIVFVGEGGAELARLNRKLEAYATYRT